jgi:hypothetical protein
MNPEQKFQHQKGRLLGDAKLAINPQPMEPIKPDRCSTFRCMVLGFFV